MPSAVRPSVTFTVAGDQVKVSLSLKGGEKKESVVIEGERSDFQGLAEKIVEAIADAVKKLN